jgi:hypothetical protein
MLDFDPVGALRASLAADRRPPDGLLHPSGDLRGSLRHSQLRAAGAPTLESDVVGDTRLMIGTLTHRWLESAFRSAPVMNEVKLDAWMPTGWTGTADAFFWNAERRGFVLVDYKTIKPEGIAYVLRDGMKEDHLWQASAYWWAAARMGIPLVVGFGVLYLPTQQLRAKDGFVQPTFQEGTPLPQELVEGVMAERWALTEAYLRSLPVTWNDPRAADLDPHEFVTDRLAPVQERVLKLTLNKQLKTPVINVSYVPHWSTEFCPYPDELCNCRQQGVTKFGHWTLEGGTPVYVPRKDEEQPADIPEPSESEWRALAKAIDEKRS